MVTFLVVLLMMYTFRGLPRSGKKSGNDFFQVRESQGILVLVREICIKGRKAGRNRGMSKFPKHFCSMDFHVLEFLYQLKNVL